MRRTAAPLQGPAVAPSRVPPRALTAPLQAGPVQGPAPSLRGVGRTGSSYCEWREARGGRQGEDGVLLRWGQGALSQAREGAPWQALYFLPEPHGHGALRAGSLVPVTVADFAALARPLSLGEGSRLGAE